MASRTESHTGEGVSQSFEVVDARPEKTYNRSSFDGDFLIVIPDQTTEDFELYAPETQFCEYIDGTIYMPSPVSINHQEDVGFLYYLLSGFDAERGSGNVLMGPAVLRLTEQRKPEPDVFVVAPGEDPESVGFKTLLVIEVLSPSNRAHDLERKAAIYREAGIPEVWYLDHRDRVLIVDRKAGETYSRERFTEGILQTVALSGFWIDVSWLWADPLPNRRRCLETILAGPPA